MSNALAVAAVTATLAHVLGEALGNQGPGEVPNVKVSTLRPDMDAATGANARGINVFLYQVTPNPAWRGDDLPTRRSDGTALTPPQQALDLHYLLSFSGNEAELEPQRLLGTAVSTLNARPVLTREVVRDAIAHALAAPVPQPYLRFADLADQVDVVRFTMLPLNFEELSKLWSTFFEVPYRLSVTYQGSVVLLTSDVPRHVALPVHSRTIDVAPLGRGPQVARAIADSGADDPITAGTPLRVEGTGLRNSITRFRIGGVEDKVPDGQVADTSLTFTLPADLRAGVHGLQILHPRAIESNVVPVVVRPVVGPGPVTTAPGASGTVDITVPLLPKVGHRQRVVVLLNGHGATSPRAYTFALPYGGEDPADSDASVAVRKADLEAGEYLVRVQVDGAESVLTIDQDRLYAAPRVTVP
ncbi:DUF4255 domain-containing protein [Streptomyces durmitorensis]|uniref:DUF4255 domain-containing protein n=1 Tax=Streptomyces durmitorensis TaxID=319947 RepID=A0ABY4Q6B1_9ACTN|nr:DUF4255 domain-containing protein [Streptomyces durmitorensis]UQT60696.1 DUF4255 domain-containing protein [Streptomyces durmitorensis]